LQIGFTLKTKAFILSLKMIFQYFLGMEPAGLTNGQSISMDLYCRESMKQYLEVDAASIFELTEKGIDFFEDFFGTKFPFSKYDMIFCPEYNQGAMENPGAVTMNDISYIFKEKVNIKILIY